MIEQIESIPERVQRLLFMAQRIADGTPDFLEVKGPGVGDHATNEFTRNLRKCAAEYFQTDLSEKSVCRGVSSRFDFYFPDEAVVVEFAFGLHNPQSEFEKDIFKCLLARDSGCPVEKLVFVAKPGGDARLKAPFQSAVSGFVQKTFGLNVSVWELVSPSKV
jgi:hypothetical protein